jgi:DNA-binding GntR family transcriptional regulator
MPNAILDTLSPLDARGPFLAGMVETTIEQAIMAGRLSEGLVLTEANLASALGVSRSPVRDALKRLAQKGLVQPRPTRGFAVATVPVDEAGELFSVREVLEGLAARFAAERMTDAEISGAGRHLDGIELRLRSARQAGYPEEDEDFHTLIHRGARAQHLEHAMEPIHARVRLLRRRCRAVATRGLAALEEHRAVLGAIGRRTPDQAEAMMRAHIRMACEALLASLQQPAVP